MREDFDEDPDPSDMDPDEHDDDVLDTHPCPNCNAEIYEDADQCPVCGHYVTRGLSAQHKPYVYIAAVVVIIAIMMTWILRVM